MVELAFKESKSLSIGVELELQLLNFYTYDLSPQIYRLLDKFKNISHKGEIKPEITQSMLEINTAPHESIIDLHCELLAINDVLMEEAKDINILLSGGGVHPFQDWRERIISPRYREVYQKYDFLMKKFTVFGQHIHVGCASVDDAIYLSHALSRYVPHFIALNASSPLYEGQMTQYDSVRLHIVDAFPLSGTLPFLTTWDEFTDYYNKLEQLGVIKNIRDLYWDIRPQPQYGTLEIRIFDAPLTIGGAVSAAAYVQALAFYLLQERPIRLDKSMYLAYSYNRFQAARYGYKGEINIYPQNTIISIQEDLLQTLHILKPFAKLLKTEGYLERIEAKVLARENDAQKMRKAYNEYGTVEGLAMFQSQQWTDQQRIIFA